jgi:Fic family protein
LEILISFAVGIAASALVSYVVYRRQRMDSSLSEQRIVFLMEQAFKSAQGAPEVLHSTVQQLSHGQQALRQDVGDLRASFAEALDGLAENLEHPQSTPARRSRKLKRLTLGALKELHRQLMPSSTPHAGELRRQPIEIAGSRHTPPPPEGIAGRLSALLDAWNSSLESLPTLDRDQQIQALTSFHHAFLSIHPFLDGNGALARALLSAQLRAVFGITRPVLFRDRSRYFEALQRADSGDLSGLEEIIRELARPAA